MVSNYNEIGRIFYRDGYRLAENHLSAGYSPESLSQLTFAAYDSIDNLNKAFTDRVKKDKMNLDCKKGCYWCCSQAIFVNQHEALFLADFLLKNSDRDEIIRLKKSINAYHYVTSEMNLRTRLLYKRFCPFLNNKICSVYEARPVACRAYLSENVQSCLYEYKYPADPDHFPRLFDFPLHTAKMLNEGIAAYFREKNCEIFEMPLETALFTCLKFEDPYNAWLDGDLVFEEPELSPEEMDLLDQHMVNQ